MNTFCIASFYFILIKYICSAHADNYQRDYICFLAIYLIRTGNLNLKKSRSSSTFLFVRNLIVSPTVIFRILIVLCSHVFKEVTTGYCVLACFIIKSNKCYSNLIIESKPIFWHFLRICRRSRAC